MRDPSAPGESASGTGCDEASPSSRLGFIGLGHMGEPMAINLVRAGARLEVWNRSPEATQWFGENGVRIAKSQQEVFDRCGTVILMLASADAIDAVLCRGTPHLRRLVAGRTVINMGTVSPEYSEALCQVVGDAGGRFIECPVSGSRVPAEQGTLVAMYAGPDDAFESVKALISPMCARVFKCGPVPRAIVTKLAVNHFLITMVTGLVEAAHFAMRKKLDLQQFSDIIGSGPMASSVSAVKLLKITTSDISAQASLRDVLMNAELIADAARRDAVASPLLDKCVSLYREANDLGVGQCDMIAVLASLEAQTALNEANLRIASIPARLETARPQSSLGRAVTNFMP